MTCTLTPVDPASDRNTEQRPAPSIRPARRIGRAPACRAARAAALAAALLALAGCGGGGGDSPAAPGPAPAPTADEATVSTSYASVEREAAAAVADTEMQAVAAAQPVGAGILPPRVLAYCSRFADWRNCGEKSTFTLQVNGQAREYIVWRPKTTAQRQNVPVVFMLHGTSGDGELFWDISAWREKALREGFYTVFPSSLKYCYLEDDDRDPATPMSVQAFTKWADGQLGTGDRPLCTPSQAATLAPAQRAGIATTVADDVAFLRAIAAEVKSRFPRTDPKRLYISGFSNGAAMSARAAAEMADLFAAAHSAASTLTAAVADVAVASRPISVVHTVGDADEEQKVAFGFGAGTIPLTESLMTDPTNPRYRADVVARFLRVLQIPDVYAYSAPTVSGVITSRFDYATSARGNVFRTVVIQGATHEYPNGRNHPVVMADEIWPFFAVYALP